MIDDDTPLTPEQSTQVATGQYLALSGAVHALISIHPQPDALRKALSTYFGETAQLLALNLATQRDQGMRQAYSETVAGLFAALPKS